MCKSKHSFTLWSIFFILMMGTFAYQTNKSTPDRARHMVNVLEEGGQSRRTTSFGFPFPEDAEVHNREMMHNHKKPVEFRARKINPVAAFEGFLEDTINRCLGELGYWLSDLGLFPLERRRMKVPDCTLDNPPKVSEAHGTEDNNNRFNEINSQSPIRQMGKTSPAIRGQVDQNESDIVDNRSSGKEVKRLQKMVKDGQRTGLDENADSCRVNETEFWPDQRKGKTRRALQGQVDQSESDIIDKRSSGKEVKRPHKMVKDGQRTGLDKNADSCRVNETEFYRAAMEQRISYAFLAIAFLAGLTFVCFVLRHWTKQPTQKEEVFDTPCNAKNTEDIVRHQFYEHASRNWNLSTPDYQGNAESSEVIGRETQKENEQPQKDRSQSDNYSKEKLDSGEDQAESPTWTVQQPASETERTIASKTNDVHPSPISEAGMRYPDGNKGGKEFKGHDGSPQEINRGASNENEQHQKDRPQSHNGSKQNLDADRYQAKSQPWTLKQPVHESKETIDKNVDEDQTSSTQGAEMQSPKENIDGNGFKGHAGMPQEITPEASNENEQHQKVRPQSHNGSKQNLDADRYPAKSQPWTLKQPVHESKETIDRKDDEDQTSSTQGAEMQSPKENIDGNGFKGHAGMPQEITPEASNENEQHQKDRPQSHNGSKQNLDADRYPAKSQPWTLKQPVHESKETIDRKDDEDQTSSTQGAEMQSLKENIDGNGFKGHAGMPQEITPEASNENEQHQKDRPQSHNGSKQNLDADRYPAKSQPWTLKQPVHESKETIDRKDDEDQTSSTQGAEMQSLKENIDGNGFKGHAGMPQEITPEASNENEQHQKDRPQSHNGSKQNLDADRYPAKSQPWTLKQPVHESKETIDRKDDEDQTSSTQGAEMQSPKENIDGNGFKGHAGMPQEITPEASNENEQHQKDRPQSHNGSKQNLDADRYPAKSQPWTLKQPVHESKETIDRKDDEDQTSSTQGAEMQSLKENIDGNGFKGHAGMPQEITPEASNENEQHQKDRPQSHNGSKQNLDADRYPAKSQPWTLKQPVHESKETIDRKDDEDQTSSTQGAEMQSPKENIDGNGFKGHAGMPQEITPEASNENEQHQKDRPQSHNGSKQNLDADRYPAKSQPWTLKQPVHESKETIDRKDDEDQTSSTQGAEMQSLKENIDGNGFKGHAGMPQEITPEASNENEQHQKDRPQSHNGSKQNLDADRYPAKSQPWTLKQPVHESKETIDRKDDEDQTSSTQGAEMQSPKENIDGNGFKGHAGMPQEITPEASNENEQHQKDRPQSHNGSKQNLDADRYPAKSQPWTLKQPVHESKETIDRKDDEDQTSSTQGAEMQSLKENIDGNGFKGHAGMPQEITPEASNENEQHQKDRPQSHNGSKQNLDADRYPAKSQPWTLKQPVHESKETIDRKDDEDQTSSTQGAEMQSLKENIDGNGFKGHAGMPQEITPEASNENEQHQKDRPQSHNGSKQNRDADRYPAKSQPWTLKQPVHESKETIDRKDDEDQTSSTQGAEMQSPKENIDGNGFKGHAGMPQEITPEASNENEQHQKDRPQSHNGSKQNLDADRYPAKSQPWTLKQPVHESKETIDRKDDEDQTSSTQGAEMQSLKENIDGNGFKGHAGMPQEITPEASNENEQHQKDRPQSHNGSKQNRDADRYPAKSQPWTLKQPVHESKETIDRKDDEDQTSSTQGAEMQSPKENIDGNGFKGHAGMPQEITPEASNENEQHQKDRPQSHNGSKQNLDADRYPAKSQPWTLKQPVHESKETIDRKDDEDQTSSTQGAEMQSLKENIDGNGFKGHAGMPQEITPEASNENEQHQKDRPQSHNGSKQNLDADRYPAKSQPWTLKQPVHESKETIDRKDDEDQTSSTQGAEMQSPKENIDGNGFKGHAGMPQEITPETSNENEQHQKDRPQSHNGSKQNLDADRYQAKSQPWTLKQPVHESKETIDKDVDEDQTSSTQGAEMQSPKENIDGNDVKRQHRNNLGTESMEQNLPKARLISDIYVEPKITMKQHEHENLTGETNTHICEVEYNESFTLSNIESDETTISVVYGAAGMGKTTLIQKIINDWAREVKFREFDFVLPFKIQNLNAIKSPIALSTLIIDSYPYFKDYLDHLWSEPKKLLFIFDELDQLYRTFTLPDTHRNVDPRFRGTDTESKYLVCDIVRCLLQGEFLRGCSVLITTRDWKLDVLHHATTDSTFELMGFTSEKAKQYFRRYLRNGQRANTILEFIEQSNILCNMCSDPLFCVTLASSLESFQAQGEEQTTIPIGIHTQVLSDYVAQLLAKCGYDGNTNQKCLSLVGELADKGIKQNTLLIEGNALTALDSCPPMFISAFLYQDPDKQSDGVIYEFRHSVLRDFLAALTNVLNAPVSRLKQILHERPTDITGRFSIFSIFLVGLSSRKSTDRLERELQTFRTEVTSCISEWLSQSVSRRLKDMDTKHTQRMFLCILYCLLEFRDNEIMKEVLNLITSIKLNHLRLKSPDCIVLSRTLMSLQMIQELDLSSCFAQPVAIWKLEEVLPRCVILRLNQNNLQDSGVKRLFDVLKNSNVKTLALKSNHLTDNCLESVFSALTKNTSLMQLNLSNSSQDGKQTNQFTDEKLKYHYERSAQQKEIKWLRIKDIGQDFTRSSKESNCLTLITD
ncbi:uncharacterized protein LOC132389263 [Hypanus sabinus]|uniref:uncharacterized protein LOC132389263 n=1 Tax=Hypanus sabinus TaxID=79690 RepID=UPI0028C4233F|nr:uncharacterized protein LOC132389263 [Hypanus sabinus]